MTRMGRRPTGGAGPNLAVLRRHIKLASKNHNLSADVDQLVEHLRSAHPPYSRLKLTPFRSLVSRIITPISPNPKRFIDDDDVGSDESAPNTKKIRKFDDMEEKLRLIEDSHVRNRKVLGDNIVTSGGSSSSLVSASSNSDDSSSGEGSTSEDAVYGEEYEPEHDLMKSLMRDKLLRNGKRESKQDVELEVVNDKDVKSLGQTDGKRLALGDDGRSSRDGGRSNDGGGDGVHAPKFKDLGGMHNVIEELMIEVIVPLCYPQLPRFLGVKPISGILLHGPPGCGKTKLAHAIANETGLPFYKISATELVSGVSGASEENLRALFDKAHETAPSIVFIDEIDAIASKRENLQREMERRIVTQLMTCMDELHRSNKPGYVLVIGATNRADAVDPALRRGGRFDREIHVGVPDESARAQILSVLTKNLKVEGAFDLNKIARSTPGFVGADLTALTNKAGILAMKRIVDRRKVKLSSSSKESTDQERCEDWWRQPWSDNELDSLSITMYDFEEAAKTVQPSLTREGFSVVPNVKWDDVGGLCSLREEFDHCIVRRIKFPKDYDDFGVNLETGFVLWGPPGCGKTLIAKAVANEAGANFIHVKGPELLNKYVGESELGVRTMFTRARTCSPCILFFDEIDALTTKRGKEGGWVVERVLNQLLIELDGAEQRRGVFVIGATNRVEVMDPAILRPGRLGKLMYVPLPSSDERGMILKALCRNKPIDSDVDLVTIAGACENFSGADLSALVNEAAMAALNDNLTARSDGCDGKDKSIKGDHFRRALEKISPSVSESQMRYYESLFQKLHKRKDSLDSSSTVPPTYSYS